MLECMLFAAVESINLRWKQSQRYLVNRYLSRDSDICSVLIDSCKVCNDCKIACKRSGIKLDGVYKQVHGTSVRFAVCDKTQK